MRVLDIIAWVVMLATIGLVIHNGNQIGNLDARVARQEARQPNLATLEDHRAVTTRIEVKADQQDLRREMKRQTRDRMLERFAKSARLTQYQIAALEQSVEEARQRKQELYAAVRSGDLPAPNAVSELQQMKQTFRAGLNEILDSEQYSRFVTMSRQWWGSQNRRRGGGRRPGGAARPGQPQ